MDNNMKMQALCAAFDILSRDESPSDSIRSWKEAIAGRINDLSVDIMRTEEPKPTNTPYHKSTINTTDEISF